MSLDIIEQLYLMQNECGEYRQIIPYLRISDHWFNSIVFLFPLPHNPILLLYKVGYIAFPNNKRYLYLSDLQKWLTIKHPYCGIIILYHMNTYGKYCLQLVNFIFLSQIQFINTRWTIFSNISFYKFWDCNIL